VEKHAPDDLAEAVIGPIFNPIGTAFSEPDIVTIRDKRGMYWTGEEVFAWDPSLTRRGHAKAT
jgi:hypothetical protein